uniref:Uncharacterized protein n=1 Tax=Arundo donax TaxID=35708 RepID=A0A0A9CIE8_ARUDO
MSSEIAASTDSARDAFLACASLLCIQDFQEN